MLVVARARLVQLAGNMGAVCEEARRLEHRPKFRTLSFGKRRHPELSHVGEHIIDVIVALQLRDAVDLPARREPRVLLDEAPSLGPPVLTDAGAELQVPPGLLHPLLEIIHPHLAVSVHELVQLLETQEKRARWGPD